MTLAKAVFFDRDGVLVRAFPEGETTRGPRTIEEIEYLPDVQESCQRLRQAGYKLIMVTNQPDVARGAISRQDTEAICREIVYSIPLDAYYICCHDQNDGCSCRKPSPGMLFTAAYEHDLRLPLCAMIGDRWTDITAAINAVIPQRRAVKLNTNCGIQKEIVEWILKNSE